MRPCSHCADSSRCRVPSEIRMMERVLVRLQEHRRQPLLCERLDHYVHAEQCLIDAGLSSRMDTSSR
ncbi:MAG: hypothetical protein ACM31L_03610 [Actinomycetota bacterium]